MIDGIENVILSLYSKGMTNSDIEEQMREVRFRSFYLYYLQDHRSSDSGYCKLAKQTSGSLFIPALWMDGIVFKVREGSKVINKTIYMAIGLRTDGRKGWSEDLA